MSEIYQPAEDSYLLAQTLKREIKNKDIRALEIGCGSGVQLKALKELGIKNIFGVDISPDAIEHCKQLGFKCIESDLFSKLKGKYDLIIFNPPYLPDHEFDKKRDTSGGKKGSEIINRFLKKAHKYLNKNARVFLLVSSLTKHIKWEGYNKKIISRKKLFFEELYIYKLWEKR